mmetsp:Transcript_8740/g.19764  ORF Transcript_8740/g.19764 Transcript_8740/m.19764 type:complete len:83 (+) Transcript_8740:128-376(+)
MSDRDAQRRARKLDDKHCVGKQHKDRTPHDVPALDPIRSQDEVHAERQWQKDMREKETLDPAALDALEKEVVAAAAAALPPK